MHRILLVIIILFSFSSCKLDPFETLAATENGIVFSKLPTFIGGGVHQKVYAPKQKILLMPWEQVYKLDTGLQTVSWGAKGEGDNSKVEDFVQTRALDGNEVSLTMTVSYRVMPEKVGYVIQKIGVTNEAVKQLVTVVARSDIRTYMNFLRTDDFSNSDERTKRVLQIKNAMNSRLQPEGIEIIDVLYVKHQFSRAMADGTLDTRYQDEINETYRTVEKTEQERNRNKTVEEEMKRKYAETEGEYYKIQEQADGIVRQSEERGKARFEAKKRDSERVYNVGVNEVEAMKKEIEAFSGVGGRALLRREIAKALSENEIKFIIMNSSAGSIDFSKTDNNELMKLLGINAANILKEEKSKPENKFDSTSKNN